MNKQARRENITGYLFLIPWLIGIVVFTIYPMFRSMYLSMTDYSLMKSVISFVGFENYQKMFSSKVFYTSLTVTAKYAIFSVPIHLALALIAALALNRKVPGIGIYRTIFYLPSFIGGTVGVAIMWKLLFSESGFVNSILNTLGLSSVRFFNSPQNALPTLIGISMWVLGSQMLIFLAGLQNIPVDLYESATIDGASSFKKFWKITLPMLSPVILYNLIMAIINALQVFTSGYVITKGGPAKSTYFYVLYLYEESFVYFRMGYASALAWFLFFVILLLTLLVLKVSGKTVFYEAELKK